MNKVRLKAFVNISVSPPNSDRLNIVNIDVVDMDTRKRYNISKFIPTLQDVKDEFFKTAVKSCLIETFSEVLQSWEEGK